MILMGFVNVPFGSWANSLNVNFVNSAIISPGEIHFSAIVNIESSLPKSRINRVRYFGVKCKTDNRKCLMVRWFVGPRVDVMSVYVDDGGRVIEASKNNATVEFVSLGLFKIDLEKKKIFYSLSGSGWKDEGVSILQEVFANK